jgi:sugar phosphate isomerase/epimerase
MTTGDAPSGPAPHAGRGTHPAAAPPRGAVDRRWPPPLGASTLFAAHSEPFTPALLDRLQRLGVAAVEIADYHANFTYDDAGWLDQARGWLTGRGLALHSIHAHFEGRAPGSDLASPEETTRRESLALYRGGLAALSRLGGAILVTHHIAIPSPESEPEAHARRREAFVASLRELARVAADLGVQLAIENGGSGWRADVTHLRALLADAGGPVAAVRPAPQALGLCLDTGHRHLQGDVAAGIRLAGPALSTLHIHDNFGARDEHRMPPDGTIDWPSVVRALRETGYAGVFLYEVGKDADVRRLPASYRTLMALA